MKAVVDDDSSVDGDDEIGRADEDEEEYDKLELKLSIGWEWKGGMSMDGGRREWFSQWDQNVGSSRFFERQPAARQAFTHRQPIADPALRFWGDDLVATPFGREGPAGFFRLDDETISETERAMSDRERDNQHKRPKVIVSLE